MRGSVHYGQRELQPEQRRPQRIGGADPGDERGQDDKSSCGRERVTQMNLYREMVVPSGVTCDRG